MTNTPNDDSFITIFILNSTKLRVVSGHYLNVIWESEGNCLVLILYVSKKPVAEWGDLAH